MFFSVVMDFYSENDDGADCCDDVGNYEGPVFEDNPLNNKENGAKTKHAEGGKSDSVSFAGSNC